MEFKKIRLPDLTFFSVLIVCIASIVFSLKFNLFIALFSLPFYIFLISVVHVYSKFFLDPSKIISVLGAFIVNSLMLFSYFLGRFYGLIILSKKVKNRKVIIFFDYEGAWGMPKSSDYDLDQTTENILEVLKKNHAKATFNICGIIANKHPVTVKKILDGGHEIASHGYEHENFAKLTTEQISKTLDKSEEAIRKVTGRKIFGFRAPYLYNPYFYNERLYRVLKERNYFWVSNRQVTRLEEFFNVILVPKILSTLFLPLLNLPIVLRDNLANRNVNYLNNIFWLFGNRNSFNRKGIIEIPLSSTMDNFLFGTPYPSEVSVNAK
jgi:hypothetical protein